MAQPLGFVFSFSPSHSYLCPLLPLPHSASLFKRLSLRSAFSLPVNQARWRGLFTFLLDAELRECCDLT